jgi:hypothetical protein
LQKAIICGDCSIWRIDEREFKIGRNEEGGSDPEGPRKLPFSAFVNVRSRIRAK